MAGLVLRQIGAFSDLITPDACVDAVGHCGAFFCMSMKEKTLMGLTDRMIGALGNQDKAQAHFLQCNASRSESLFGIDGGGSSGRV